MESGLKIKLFQQHHLRIMKRNEVIQHLYARAGFGLSPNEWQEKNSWTIEKAIDELFQKDEKNQDIPIPDQPGLSAFKMKNLNNERKNALRKEGRIKINQLSADWINRMADEKSNTLLEKMTLFWHGHFACITKNPTLAAIQLNTLRKHALGNFRNLVLAMAKDVSMIRFLNNQQNKKATPNENFARELMELFTIGRGNYTEKDIKEAARAFTGWSSNLSNEFVFRARQHDYGRKIFMGQKGNFDGDDIINIILSKKQTARFISEKIYRFFVNENISEIHVKQMASRFYQSEYDIADLMRFLFSRDWFYNQNNIGIKIKSPVELLVGLMKTLSLKFEDHRPCALVQQALGQKLFNPPNVAGWQGGKAWIDNSNLLVRLNLAGYLFLSADVKFGFNPDWQMSGKLNGIRKLKTRIDFDPLILVFNGASNEEIAKLLPALIIQPTFSRPQGFLQPFLSTTSRSDYIKTLTLRLLTLPEFQLC